MGLKYSKWLPRDKRSPINYSELRDVIESARAFHAPERLDYGDHGLQAVFEAVLAAVRGGKRIALYADYDVDGTMSCVSWIWFLQSIGYHNFVHYIPCRFKEGYGLNLKAVEHLIEHEKAELIITMDTGITANAEASYCLSKGVQFICTDHHKIQAEKMPDCLILNPKLHPDPMYQELCGCGITFVLLRKLAAELQPPAEVWTDLLALAGMATICDVVPLNGVNHSLARQGISALMRSKRPVLVKLREACAVQTGLDEKDVGFRLGPRINAVGRLEHADIVVQAFVGDDPGPLIRHMELCNERRKTIQHAIVAQAREQARDQGDAPILFLGGEEWHPGVVGIAASKIVEEFWRPTWMFQVKDGVCKGSARSLTGFDVTDAMGAAGELFSKFGGHKAAGGFSFPVEHREEIKERLIAYAKEQWQRQPEIWESKISYDCAIPANLLELDLADMLDDLKPFGHGFEEPLFLLEAEVVGKRYFNDKVTGEPKHTAVMIAGKGGPPQKILFFNQVIEDQQLSRQTRFVVSASRNVFRGQESLSLYGHDLES